MMSATITTLAVAAFRSHGKPPLHLLLQVWRYPESIPNDAIPVARLRAALQATTLLGEPLWPAAVAGDIAELVGITLRAVHKNRPTPLTVDLIGTALLLSTLDGNTTAEVALHHLRRKFVVSHSPDRMGA